ncbi:methyltransferase [Bacillus swezeyi]|uniref:methyltransferase n=1 Tax=Bacillus swezeyi TaxID=1925020 RepID=UPI002E207580|nr:methyltransferase [Bacillus swezeyi]
MFFNKKQIDKLLDDHTEEEQKETKSKVNTSFIIVFYFSILLSICTFFFDYRYFLIALFGPTILVTFISPPLQIKKGIYRIFSAIYLILLITVTFFWLK